MLTWVAIALALGAVVLVVRWVLGALRLAGSGAGLSRSWACSCWRSPPSPPRRRASCGGARSGRSSGRRRRWSGFPVDVQCQSFGGAFVDAGAELGWVPYGADGVPERRTLIKYEPCGDLRRYLSSDKSTPTCRAGGRRARAHARGDAHVGAHGRGRRPSALRCSGTPGWPGCWAPTRGGRGAGGDVLAVGLSRGCRTPYTTADCRPGGRLDEHLPDPPWGAAAQRSSEGGRTRQKQGQGDLAPPKRRRRSRGRRGWRPSGRSRSRWCGRRRR